MSNKDIEIYLNNRQKEIDGAALYRVLAETEKQPQMAEVYKRLSASEEKHAATWEKKLRRWTQWNNPKKKLVNGLPVPDPNEEILLYQTMLGAWPLGKDDVPAFRKRLQDYIVKATREAMVHTKWTNPNIRHEQALIH